MRILLGLCLLLVLQRGFAQPEIAIAEWCSNPNGSDATGEWVELHNYGDTTLNLRHWRLRDADNDDALVSGTDFFLAPDAHCVLARNKTAFETNWFDGVPQPAVLEVGMSLGNTEDEIILAAPDGTVVWQIVYPNDDAAGFSTFLTDSTYALRMWGEPGVPGIDRTGTDPASGTPGYQHHAATSVFVRTAVNGDVGSPLTASNPVARTRGNALRFDGTDDQVQFGNAFGFNYDDAFTVQTWLHLSDDATQNAQIFAKYDSTNAVGYTFGIIGATGQLTFGLTNFTVSPVQFFEVRAGVDLRDGAWHHIAVTYDGSGAHTGARLYVDGANRTQLVVPGTVSASILNGVPATLGNYAAGPEFLRGALDEFRVWNTVRTAAQLRETTFLTSPEREPELLAYYTFHQTAGATFLRDATGRHSGTFQGFGADGGWEASPVPVGYDTTGRSAARTVVNVPEGGSFVNFGAAHLTMQFTEHSVAEDLTVVYQHFPPNQTTGVDGLEVFDRHIWVLAGGASDAQRTVNARLNFPDGTFTNAVAGNYALYHRPLNGTGAWTLIDSSATALGGTSMLTFSGVEQFGQWMVARTGDALPVATRDVRRPEFRLYPNPATDVVRLHFRRPVDVQKIGLTNALGRSVLTLEELGLRESILLDVAQLPHGWYQIRVHLSDGRRVNKSLLIQR